MVLSRSGFGFQGEVINITLIRRKRKPIQSNRDKACLLSPGGPGKLQPFKVQIHQPSRLEEISQVYHTIKEVFKTT